MGAPSLSIVPLKTKSTLTVRRSSWFTYAVERRYPVYLQRASSQRPLRPLLADGGAAPHDEPTVRRNRDLAPERPKHVLPLIERARRLVGATTDDHDGLGRAGRQAPSSRTTSLDAAAAGGGIVSVKLEIIKLELGNADAD